MVGRTGRVVHPVRGIECGAAGLWLREERGRECVEMLSPALDHDLGFVERVEDFAVETTIMKLRAKALTTAVLP